MKSLFRILWLLLPALLMTTVLQAQMYTGLRGGVSLTKWHFDLPEGTSEANDAQDYLPAPYVAVPLEVQLSDYFSLQPELMFTQMGSRQKHDFTENYGEGSMKYEMDLRTRINYLAVPVLGKAMYRTGVTEVFALAGPQVGYALSGKYKSETTISNGTSETSEEELDIDFKEDEMSRLDYGLVFGAGLGVDAGPGKVVLDARYYLGLNNLCTAEDLDEKIHNRGFGFSVGYMVPLGQ